MNDMETTNIQHLASMIVVASCLALVCLAAAHFAVRYLQKRRLRWTQPLLIWFPAISVAGAPVLQLVASTNPENFVSVEVAYLSMLGISLMAAGLKLANDQVELKKGSEAARVVRNSTDWFQRVYRMSKNSDGQFELLNLANPYIGENAENGKPVRVKILNVTHGLAPGGSGMGKTHFLILVAMINAAAGRAVIIVDPKGDLRFAMKMLSVANWVGRPFQFFSMRKTGIERLDEKRHSFPIMSYGLPSEIANALLNSLEFDNPHYRAIVEYGVTICCVALLGQGVRPNLRLVRELLMDPRDLANRLSQLADELEREGRTDDEHYAPYRSGVRFLDQLAPDEVSGLRGAATRCATLIDSDAGPALLPSLLPEIDFVKGIKRGDIIHMSVDAQTYPDLAPDVVAFALSALSSAAGTLNAERWNGKACAIIDEMGSLTGEQGRALLERSRSAGITTWWSPQSLAGITETAGMAMTQALLDNCDFFCCFRQQSPTSAEELASLVGTEAAPEATHQEEGLLGKHFGRFTGLSSVRIADHYIVHPNEFKRLRKGRMVMVDSTDERRVEIVDVRSELHLWQLGVGE